MKSLLQAKKRRKAQLGWSIAVFLTVLLIYCLWIWQGLDVTDEGYDLTRQWLAVSEPEHYEIGMVWLTDVIGGGWLSIVGELGLIGARLGWALCMALTALVTFLILRNYYPARATALGAICAAAALGFHGTAVLDYNTLPALFLTAGAGVSLLSHRQFLPRCVWLLLSVGAGVLLGVAATARFPLVLSFWLPFVIPVVRALFADQRNRHEWQVAAIASGVACLTFLFGVVVLIMRGDASEWLQSIVGAVTVTEGSHSLRSLIHLYYSSAVVTLSSGMRFLLGSGVVAVFLAGLLRHTRKWRVPLIAICGALYVAFLVEKYGDRGNFSWLCIGLVFSMALGLMLLFVLQGKEPRARDVDVFSLLVVGCAVAVLQMIGSNNGFFATKYALWLLFPSVFLAARETLGRLLDKHPGWGLQALVVFPLILMIGFAVDGFFIRARNPYRDLMNPFLLVEEVQHPRLRYVRTSHERARALDALLLEVEARVEPGDVILAWHRSPMLHYLTETIPALGNPWPSLLAEEVLWTRWEEMWESGGPGLVVEEKIDTASRTWGVIDSVAPQYMSIDLPTELVPRGYRAIWENDCFVIWERTDVGGGE